MKIEWYERHEIEISPDALKHIADNMEEYAEPYGWSLVEDCLEEWLGSIERYNVSQYIDNWEELVAKIATEVEKYRS